MLNYGYGILANNVRAQIVAAGFDPSIGILHGNAANSIPLVYDLMEPLRPIIDRAVLDFALSHTFSRGDFTINKWGGCRLNPQMAKVIVEKVSRLDCAGVIRKYLGQR
jgi:CRISPR-associated endonuclease Cas1